MAIDGLTILLIDDDPDDRTLVMRELHTEFPDLHVEPEKVMSSPLGQSLTPASYEVATQALSEELAEEDEPRIEAWEKLIHPDDVAHVREVLRAHLEGKTPFYESEHLLRTKSGEWKWVLDRGRVLEWDASGKTASCGGHAPGHHGSEAGGGGAPADRRHVPKSVGGNGPGAGGDG